MDTKINIIIADYSCPEQAQHIGYLINHYAQDAMSLGRALDDDVINNLAASLAKIPHAFTILAYADKQPVGMINCFEGFSTFACKPLVNINDVVVLSSFRGLGISQMMVDKVEEEAIKRGCCKMTLDVLEGNKAAQHVYLKKGFEVYEVKPDIGKACFWQKWL